jgi:YD repeat-containing protein
VADGLNSIDTGHWEGAAADAFRAKFSPEPPKWSDASSAMGKASASLESYAGVVESSQSQAQHAIDLWNQGQEATKQATAAHNQQVNTYNTAADAYNAKVKAGQDPGTKPTEPGAFSDPGQPLREEARQVLTGARQARNTAAASASAAVKAATSLAPQEPSFWDRAKDDVSDAFSAGQLADTSMTTGILDGVADIGKFARSLDPEDPWNARHPAEYLAGLNGTLAGVADMAVSPGTAAKAVFGTGWGSDPFQAAGKLVPNVALTLFTDGGGAAADAGDVAADAGDLSDTSSLTDDNPDLGKSSEDPDTADTSIDPVDLITGNVLLRQTDVSLPGALPLVLRRVHKSAQRAGLWFGESWASSFDQRILIMPDRIMAVLADGQVLVYRRAEVEDGSAPGGTGTPAIPAAGPAWPMTRDGDDAYTITDQQEGLTWRFERHPAYWQYTYGMGEFPLTSLSDRAGHEITFTYGPSGEPVSVTHSGGYQVDVTVEHDRVTALSLGGTVLMRYAYDKARRLSEVINSLGQPMRLLYDDAGDGGRISGYVDRNGTSYQYAYDEAGRCVRGWSPDGTFDATYEYRDGKTIWTDATGAVRTYEIDRSARITAMTDPLGGVTRYTHDNRNRKTSETDPLGRVTEWEYDDLGYLVSVTRPDGAVARAAYDGQRQPVELEEPGRGTWRQEFDNRGNRVSLTQPDGTVIRYSQDERGHLASVTGTDGLATAVECDALGLPASVTEPGGAITQYERDEFGRVTQITGPDGAVTTMSWSVEGRPLSRTFSDGAAESWTWSPDGSLLRHVSTAGAATSYEYGPFDAVTSVTGPDRTRTFFGYDGELRLTSIEHGGLTWAYAHDPAGRMVSETDYNGAQTQYQLDAAGQVIRRLNATGQEIHFDYDALGNVVSQISGDGITAFEYDAAGDLVRAQNADATLFFERDVLGRLTAESCNGQTVRTDYDPAGRVVGRITPSGAQSAWTYDSTGLPASLVTGGTPAARRSCSSASTPTAPMGS